MKRSRVYLASFLTMALMLVACAGPAPAFRTLPSSTVVPASTARLDPTVQELLAIAQALMIAEHDILAIGNADALNPGKLPLTAEAATGMAGIVQRQLARHDGLAACGARYTDLHTTVELNYAAIAANQATLAGSVHNEWTLTYGNRISSEAVASQEQIGHVFHFERVDGRWLFTQDEPEAQRLASPLQTPWWAPLWQPQRVPTPAVPFAPSCPGSPPSGALVSPQADGQ